VNPRKWFGIIIIYTAVTLLCVFLIPSNSIFSFLRVVLAFIFVAIVPGYCLVNFLFQEGKLDLAEITVLSVALSFSIAGISGLFLGLSPIGITVSSITEALSFIVIVLAVLALLRKSGLVRIPSGKLRTKNLEQVNNQN
jgi:uncharacterized membrane protein